VQAATPEIQHVITRQIQNAFIHSACSPHLGST
jgi:hypothetical protein